MFFKQPLIYIKVTKYKAFAINLDSQKTEQRKTKAFNHPRTLMACFYKTRQCFNQIFNTLRGSSFIEKNPIVIIDLEEVECGHTNAEMYSFCNAALLAGAYKVYFPLAEKKLSQSEIKQITTHNLHLYAYEISDAHIF